HASRSNPLRRQLSMPSARTSTFRMPSASMSSLSHSMVVRSFMAALTIGHSSDSGPRVMTKPPTCWDRWRGRRISSPERASAQAERLADIPDGAPRAVADHRGGEPRAVAAVFPVDVLDHLLAPLMLEIDVDVGRLVAGGGDEALEQQPAALGRDRRYAEAVAD